MAGGQLDLDKITDTLQPEAPTSGGLFVPGKDRVVFRPPEKKSILGLDVFARKKREELSMEAAFKVPKDRVASIAASLTEEEEMPIHSGLDELESNVSNDVRKYSNRRHREIATSETSNSVANGQIKRLQDDDIQSNVLEIGGSNVQSAYITCPADPTAILGIKLPFLVMVVKNMKKYFTFEIQVLDDKNVRRRFWASNFQRVTKRRSKSS